MPNPIHIDQIKSHPLAFDCNAFSNQLSYASIYIEHPTRTAVHFQRIAQWRPAQFPGFSVNRSFWHFLISLEVVCGTPPLSTSHLILGDRGVSKTDLTQPL